MYRMSEHSLISFLNLCQTFTWVSTEVARIYVFVPLEHGPIAFLKQYVLIAKNGNFSF